jgi:GNAT superfamily N-acetyltransferase
VNRDIQIRRAVPADADIVLTMLRELADHQDELEYVKITAQQWRDLLARPEVIVLLAERDGKALGYVSVLRRFHLWSGTDHFDLDDLYVREEARNARIGERLMVEVARLAAPERLGIRWGVAPAAQRFYERLGATLRTKTVASWGPDAYTDRLAAVDPS